MPITTHEACIEPPSSTVIGRFMELSKFRDLFANEEFYFRRVDKFKGTDPWEGLPSDDYIRRALGLRWGVVEDEVRLKAEQGFNRQYSQSSYINCWQVLGGESYEMWKEYGDSKDPTKKKETGVVVLTTVGQLRSQLQAMLDKIDIGLVDYRREDPPYNMMYFLFHKRAQFAEEKELRVRLECHDPMGQTNRNYDERGVTYREPLDENPLHPWVHCYKRRRVDLKSIVNEIRVSPFARPAEFKEVKEWVSMKKFVCPVNWSNLFIPA